MGLVASSIEKAVENTIETEISTEIVTEISQEIITPIYNTISNEVIIKIKDEVITQIKDELIVTIRSEISDAMLKITLNNESNKTFVYSMLGIIIIGGISVISISHYYPVNSIDSSSNSDSDSSEYEKPVKIKRTPSYLERF